MDTDLGVIILAGGQSVRMGRNKALLRLRPDGPTLIEMVYAVAREVSKKIVISTNEGQIYTFLHERCIPDTFSGCGPLAGLEAGFTALGTEAAFLLGCDMPYIYPLLLHLLKGVRQPGDAVIPLNADGHPEPLCALYYWSCLASLRAYLQGGDFTVRAWLQHINVMYVPFSVVKQVDQYQRSFVNLNSPQDVQEHSRESIRSSHPYNTRASRQAPCISPLQ